MSSNVITFISKSAVILCVQFTRVDKEESGYYTGRKLQSAVSNDNTSTTSHKAAVSWEQCDFEKENYRYVFLAPYIFLILSLFIGSFLLYIVIILVHTSCAHMHGVYMLYKHLQGTCKFPLGLLK